MKTLLTIIACRGCKEYENETESQVQIIRPDEGENEKDFLARALKGAKGKYSVVADRHFLLSDIQSVLNIIDKNTADMVCFVGGNAIKTSILKGLKDYIDPFSFRILGIVNCKSILKTVYNPLSFSKESAVFSDKEVEGILCAADGFVKVKAKLNKEIYTYAFNLLCDKIVLYYLCAMLKIRDKELEAEQLINFDSKLKAEIVLYLAVQKRFTYADLDKLREKEFKISWLTKRKFKKVLGK